MASPFRNDLAAAMESELSTAAAKPSVPVNVGRPPAASGPRVRRRLIKRSRRTARPRPLSCRAFIRPALGV